jgi:cell division protein FtsB
MLNKRFQFIAVGLLVLFIGAQFAILATVGTQGVKVDQVRAQKNTLRQENDHLRADIDKAKTLNNISDGLDKVYNLTPARVTVIELPHTDTNDTVAADVLP